MTRAIAILLVLSSIPLIVLGQPPRPTTCTQSRQTECPRTEPFKYPTISSDETYRYVETSGCPPYPGPGWTNPGQACESSLKYRIPMHPQKAAVTIPVGEKLSVFENITYLKEDPKPIMGAMGVLINGVNVFGVGSPCGYSSKCPQNGGPSMYVDAVESEGHTVDTCGGHPAPTHQYHIHSGIGMTTSDLRKQCGLPVDNPNSHSQLLGWMFDGYGLYGKYSLNGTVPKDLDECGGHTHDIRGVQTYHYHIPDGFPWTIGCFRGCPEVSNNPRELQLIANNAKYGCK